AFEKEFASVLEREMRDVRAVFEGVITGTPSGREAEPVDLSIFANPSQAGRGLIELAQGSPGAHVAPRTRQVFRKLRPLLLDWLAKVADPDATLNQFVRFVQAYGLRSLLFELLVTNPRLLELLVKTFDASQFAGSLLIRRPQLLEDVP